MAESPAVRRYRVHLIIMADGFPNPRSFRSEAYAHSHNDAFALVEQWLRQQPLTGLQTERSSSELVPEPF
jgi:hypothetical protein